MNELTKSFIVKDDLLKVIDQAIIIQDEKGIPLYKNEINNIAGVEFVKSTDKHAGVISLVNCDISVHSFCFHRDFESHYKNMYDYLLFYSRQFKSKKELNSSFLLMTNTLKNCLTENLIHTS